MFAMALGLGLLTAAANLLGSYLATLRRPLSRWVMGGLLGLGGGFILGAAFLELLPEALEARPGALMPLLVTAGYLGTFVLEQLLNVHLHRLPAEDGAPHPHESGSAAQQTASAGAPAPLVPVATGLAAIVAFNVHDFLDGVAIGTSMRVGTELGLLVFFAVLLHEIPAGVVVGTVALAAGGGRGKALAAGASIGLITLVGIALPFWLGGISPALGDGLLALATGTFVYVGATILIPLSEAGRSRWVPLSVVLGFGVFALTAKLVSLLFSD